MKLVVLTGELQGTEFPLTGSEMTLGRRPEADISLSHDPRVSRHHASLLLREGHWYIEDAGSANGTYVNDRRIHEPTRLRIGDRIRVGRTWLEVVPEPVPAAQREAERLVSMVEQTGDGAAENVVMEVGAVPQVPRVADADALRQRLLILMQVGEALGSTLELDELLRRILDYIFEVLPAERGVILLNGADGQPTPRIVRLRTGGDDTAVTVSRNIVDRALAGHVTILTEDALTDERFQDASSIQDLGIRAALCAPLVHRGEAIGAIYLDTTSDIEMFGPDAVELINAIAPQAAAAIANATLYAQVRAAYDELRRTQEQLLQAEKLSTIGTLAASLAHDMANIVAPLGPITHRLQREGKLEPREQEIAVAQVQRLNTLIRRLMSFARPQQTQRTRIQPAELVQSTVAMVETEARHRRVTLVTELADHLPAVAGDRAQLEQALLNLLINAIEVCTEGGTVKITAGVDGDDLAISVSDNGPGIPIEVQEKLFEPFFTTKPQGTGLGLYSARRIVQEEHGGVLELDSRPGEGTTVTMRLPIQE
ncbi:MAG: ATP-binding protein [Armatimonadetes bacterium]|nr:ATP-binding protein [Armatimonadota bacterium]